MNLKRTAKGWATIPPDALGRGPFWDVVNECSAAMRAERRQHFTEAEIRRILVAVTQSEVPEFVHIWAGRLRAKARAGWKPGQPWPPNVKDPAVIDMYSRSALRGK